MSSHSWQTSINLRDASGAIIPATVECRTWYDRPRNLRHCDITLSYGERQVRGNAWDYFEALCCVRESLEESGIVPLCYGASRNVFPSGMARDMGAGLKAYKLLATAESGTSDLVEIFGCGPDVDPVSVEVQREHCSRLLMNSLRQKGR